MISYLFISNILTKISHFLLQNFNFPIVDVLLLVYYRNKVTLVILNAIYLLDKVLQVKINEKIVLLPVLKYYFDISDIK